MKQLRSETIAAHKKEPLSTAKEPYDISDDTANKAIQAQLQTSETLRFRPSQTLALQRLGAGK